jgi:reverse gyrase
MKPLSETYKELGIADKVIEVCWNCDVLIPESRQKASGLCNKCLPEDTIETLSDNTKD